MNPILSWGEWYADKIQIGVSASSIRGDALALNECDRRAGLFQKIGSRDTSYAGSDDNNIDAHVPL
jgi:hypothetical protein